MSVAPAPRPDGPDLLAEGYIAAAAVHGLASDPRHEIGDLQAMLRAALGLMTTKQRVRWAETQAVSEVLEWAGEATERGET